MGKIKFVLFSLVIGTVTNLPIYYSLYQTRQEVMALRVKQATQITNMATLCDDAVDTFDVFMLACNFHKRRAER